MRLGHCRSNLEGMELSRNRLEERGSRTRIVLANMPKSLQQIIRDLLAGDDDLQVDAKVSSLEDLTESLPPSSAIVEERVLGALSRMTSAEAESFNSALGDLGRYVRGSEVLDLTSGVLPILGTAVGTVYGGPVGAAVGGKLGTIAGQTIAGDHP